MSNIDFYFDYLSPYGYLAHTQLGTCSAHVRYYPFDIRAAMTAAGNVPTSIICKAKNRYIQADLRRWVDHYAVPFRRHPDVLNLDSNRLLRATLWAVEHGAAERGKVDALVGAIYHALWGEPAALQSASDVAAILRRCGFDALELEALIDDPLRHEALARATAGAVDRGVFGAPCIFVGDDMFFGNDRMDFVKARLEQLA